MHKLLTLFVYLRSNFYQTRFYYLNVWFMSIKNVVALNLMN